MKAFVVTLEQLFKMNAGIEDERANFSRNKRKLRIPLYQREYVWPDEKIVTLVNDIKRCNKFLGNIIMDEADTCYEIVDGQQRITTCCLILMCLHNQYAGSPREQNTLKKLIKPYGEFVLVNDSVDNYISEDGDKLLIKIDKGKDVYYQADDFERAFNTIRTEMENFGRHEKLLDFKRKLLDCEILVLINNRRDNIHPVEEIFLDINEKAQLLQPEDIFKGHCFENYEKESHQDLRELWVQLKKQAMAFRKFGYKDASDYIYLYLLETEDNSIPQNLKIGGKHYLDGKTMDETHRILSQMIAYGEDNIEFYDNLLKSDYGFTDLCNDSHDYVQTGDHQVLKKMCRQMLEGSAQYQKLPFLYLIYFLKENKKAADSGIVPPLLYQQFRKIVTNLYIYMMLFVMEGAKKTKKDIDHTVRDAVNGEDSISRVLAAAKGLRNQKVQNFGLNDNFALEKLQFVYSVIDFYEPERNWLRKIYMTENGDTLEHFIVPDNRRGYILWKDGDSQIHLTLPPEDVKKYKKMTINYLIIDRELNESIGHDDIVTKIQEIRSWYERRGETMPGHVAVVINYIEQLPEYSSLKNLKGAAHLRDEIEAYYIKFVMSYFDPENKLRDKLKSAFVEAFRTA